MNWFPEPLVEDPTWARDNEDDLAWLRRSTLPTAQAVRRFLNEQLAKLPLAIAEHLATRLASHWSSTFFELIVGRALQELGADLEVEVANARGFRPDYRARFPDCHVIVEAVSPQYDRGMAQERQRADALLPFVREALPSDWAVLLGELPDLGPGESKQAFKRAFRELVPKDAPLHADDWRDAEVEIECGTVDVTFIPRKADAEAIVAGPVVGGWDDSEERIRSVVRRKRRQVRSEPYPVLLAVAGGRLPARSDSFDRALFGRSCTVVSLPSRRSHNELRWDGLFMRPGNDSPTYAGVLAVPNAGFRYAGDPVLYLHPRFVGILPNAFAALERRIASPPHGIDVVPAGKPGLLQSLGFVVDI